MHLAEKAFMVHLSLSLACTRFAGRNFSRSGAKSSSHIQLLDVNALKIIFSRPREGLVRGGDERTRNINKEAKEKIFVRKVFLVFLFLFSHLQMCFSWNWIMCRGEAASEKFFFSFQRPMRCSLHHQSNGTQEKVWVARWNLKDKEKKVFASSSGGL